MIPSKLQQEGIKFVLIEKGGKRPFQQEWQKKIIGCYNPELLKHIEQGGNYGVMGGGEKKLIIVDFDNARLQEELSPILPKTFTVKSGRGLLHKYYFSDACDSFKIFDEELNTLADVQGEGKQVVGAGSTHPNGTKYEVIDDSDIATIAYSELKALIMKYDRKPKKEEKKEEERPTEYKYDNFFDTLKSRIRIQDVLSLLGVDTSKNPTQCPFHHSAGGKCLGFNEETAHCFHCEGSWNIFSMIKQAKSFDIKNTIEFLVVQFGLQKEHEESKKKYFEYLNSSAKNMKQELKNKFLELVIGKEKRIPEATELIVSYILSNNYIYTTKDDIKSEVWIYKDGIYVPQGRSIIKENMREILQEWYNQYFYGQVITKIEADTFIESEHFFQTNYINEIPVQNGILNILTRELNDFTPKKIFFNKCPVTYDGAKKCSAIDLFLNDVLKSEEDKKVFYELAGFALLKEYRYELAAMFVGDGRNGKSKALELLKALVGVDNCSGLPLNALVPDSFEIHSLFGKLLNLAGDIGNKDLQDTSMFKSLTGRDLITIKRKFLSSFNFRNYAKFIFACNDLPVVYDTSRGFWDRWILLEFPYTFVTKEEYDNTPSGNRILLKVRDEDIMSKIITPDELSGLLNAGLNGLDRLISNHKFSVTKGTKEVKETWIRKANSVAAFCMDFIDADSAGTITKKEFRKRYADYCKKHNIRNKNDFVVKKVLQEEFGASDERIMIGVYPDNSYSYVWTGIKWRNIIQ